VEVVCEQSDAFLKLTYAVSPADALRLPERGFGRRDGLWQSTCFEFFAKLGTSGYREFNFAPSGAWNAYTFNDWRRGMRPLELSSEPHLVDSRIDDRWADFPARYEFNVVLEAALIPPSAEASLTTIIEETDGTKSYWALAHPQGQPDFHHPDCFVLQLQSPAGP
jgi:hypothetical protein